jgi:hypothetical protein
VAKKDEAAEPTLPPVTPAELGGPNLSDEDVRRAEHPEEFADDDGEPASSGPVAPAATPTGRQRGRLRR